MYVFLYYNTFDLTFGKASYKFILLNKLINKATTRLKPRTDSVTLPQTDCVRIAA